MFIFSSPKHSSPTPIAQVQVAVAAVGSAPVLGVSLVAVIAPLDGTVMGDDVVLRVPHPAAMAQLEALEGAVVNLACGLPDTASKPPPGHLLF